MKRKITCFVLMLSILAASAVLCFAEASSESSMLSALKALGIMTGDENGELHLEQNLTRAQIAKMLCASSSYKDTVGENGLGYSLYSDVSKDHWAGEYIKLCAQQGWMTGYSNGTFKPNSNVNYAEACSAVIKFLGYKESTLAGSYPYAQISKAESLGLCDGITAEPYDKLTRRQCAWLFYNMLTAKNAQGMIYAQTLGYNVVNGKLDLASAVSGNLSGPFVAAQGESLPFKAETVYLNDKPSDRAALEENEVYYYNTGLSSVWIYNDKVSGKLTAATPSASPMSVTVDGKTYQIDSTDAAFEFSTYGSIKKNDMVTLLLGMDGKVAAVLSGDAVNGMFYGVVQASSKGLEEESTDLVKTFTVFCTDGSTRSFSVKSGAFKEGTPVSVSVSSSGCTIKSLPASKVCGKVSKSASSLDGHDFAENVKIIETDGSSALTVDKDVLAGCSLSSEKVTACILNSRGEITDLILGDVTGNLWQYGYLTSVAGSVDIPGMITTPTGVYSGYMNGMPAALVSQNSRFSVSEGGFAAKLSAQGQPTAMKNLTKLKISSFTASSALVSATEYSISENVQVYLRNSDKLYSCSLDDLNTEEYSLTAWYDSFGLSAGGKIRVIIAEKK